MFCVSAFKCQDFGVGSRSQSSIHFCVYFVKLCKKMRIIRNQTFHIDVPIQEVIMREKEWCC
jgi:hypothetical protein